MASDATAGSRLGREIRPYVVLKLDFLLLLVPQQEVRTLEPAEDLDTADPPPHGVGWIRFRGQRCPVFCFSEELRWLLSAPATRRVCAVLGAGEHVFGVMCSDVSMLRLPDAGVRPMPEAMILPGRPIHALALHEGTVMCVSSAARLIAHAQTGAGGPR